jgi:hypothetical protein
MKYINTRNSNNNEVIGVVPLEVPLSNKQQFVAAMRVYFSSTSSQKIMIRAVAPPLRKN